MSLGDEGVKDVLGTHVCRRENKQGQYRSARRARNGRRTVLVPAHAVNTQSRVTLRNLPGLDLRERLDRAETGVLSEGERDGVEGRGESSHGILLDRGDLREMERASVSSS